MSHSGSAAAGAEILPTDTPERFARAVERAAERLRAGDVVAVPTETVYGLAANAFDRAAVWRVFRIKGRPEHNPIIVHVASGAMARECVTAWPAAAERLARAFWPGPLTLVLPKTERIPQVVTAGGTTVGVRWPSHPFMQALIRVCGFPLAAPSANRANEISPTRADHVAASLGDRVGLIIDGGAAQVGIESTVVDLTTAPVRVLRPGMIHEESLGAVLEAENLGVVGTTEFGADGPEPPRSPGRLPRHYAPRARLVVLSWDDERDLVRKMASAGIARDRVHVLSHRQIPGPGVAERVCVIPNDPEAFARALYAEWHRCDQLGAATIVVEAVSAEPAWRGIADRVARAAAEAG